MKTKIFEPVLGTKKDFIEKIRETNSRTWTVKNALVEPKKDKVTVLSVFSGKQELGTVRTRSSKETENLLGKKTMDLTIGWNKSRNEVLQASFR